MAAQGLVTKPATDLEVQIVRDSHGRLSEIREKVVADFKNDVLKLAATVASTSVANFPIDSFVSSWNQLRERFHDRCGAITTFRVELGSVREAFKKEHAKELLAAFQLKLAELEEELDQRNAIDDLIEQEIKDTKAIITELKGLDTKQQGPNQGGPTTQTAAKGTTQGARARKTATKKAGKRAKK